MKNKNKTHGFFLILVLVLTLMTSLISAPIATPVECAIGDSPVCPAAATAAIQASTRTSKGELKLYPGGLPFGVRFQTEGLIVVGFSDVVSEKGKCNPAYDAGIREKDVITAINGEPVTSTSRLSQALESNRGETVTLTCKRSTGEFIAHVKPAFSPDDGRYKTGMLLRDSGAGIGTLTFIDPETLAFGGLGHGICDGDTGELIPMSKGSVLGVTINGIVKGEAGTPGEIKGCFDCEKKGTLSGNTTCGVYGSLVSLPKDLPEGPLTVASANELREGDAYIYCTLDSGGLPCRYSIRISDIDRSAKGNKCFTVKVTDKALIEKTGGIVRGMSGSPIIQNGKLVGAVTHVLVNDPTSGYGIFIENMLGQMGGLAR